MTAPLARRALLQTGAVTAGLALTAIRAQPAAAAAPSVAPITGAIAGHMRLDPMRGATIRLTELGPDGGPVRTLAFVEVPLGALYADGVPRAGSAPLRALSRRAGDLAVRVAAASWGVAPDACRLSGRRITHEASGRMLPFGAWVDFA
ncbi:MAG: hypothetical protein BGO51_08315 [Rhodospirillales bacterium 69-11]|nr:hypothetical protein [Rhodospirillales bacterium]OJW25944.1 MAG: hypothetical protein BGO51_08315 [Rhodospirillales bacterium 69-11]